MNLRQTNLDRLAKESFDVLIVGAGLGAAAVAGTGSAFVAAAAFFGVMIACVNQWKTREKAMETLWEAGPSAKAAL